MKCRLKKKREGITEVTETEKIDNYRSDIKKSICYTGDVQSG